MTDSISNDQQVEMEILIDYLWLSVISLVKLKAWNTISEICQWLSDHVIVNSRTPLELLRNESFEKEVAEFPNVLLNGLKARALRSDWMA